MNEADVNKEIFPITELPEITERQLIGIGVRGGRLLTVPFNPSIVIDQSNMGIFGSEYRSMILAHGRVTTLHRIFGIHEEVRRRFLITVGGQQREVMDSQPIVRNVWMGDEIRLYPTSEASHIPYMGQTALSWATIDGQVPEMVVKIENNYYPATENDIVIPFT